MNHKRYYFENAGNYSFNKEKQKQIIKEYKDNMLLNHLKSQYDKFQERLFDKVNTEENLLKLIDLIKKEIRLRGLELPEIPTKQKAMTKRPLEYTEKQLRLRDILIKYNCVEHGDCIVDEICELFNHELTPE